MTVILIVEGNDPDQTEARRADGLAPYAEVYAAVLARLAPGLEFRIARPLWPGSEPLDLDGIDAVALTGSGIRFSADAPEVRPHLDLLERVFAAGLPTIGSCFGLQTAAVLLGGSVRASPNGRELGIARRILPTEAGRSHPMLAGRGPVFDCVCIHRDEVARPPSGAVLTASNAHSEVQAMAYEQGGIRFWGMQYHPELTLADAALSIRRSNRGVFLDPGRFESPEALDRTVTDFTKLTEAPEAHPALAWRYGAAPEVLDPDARAAELSTWLHHEVGVARGQAAVPA